MWDLNQRKRIAVLPSRELYVDCQFSPDGRRLAAYGQGGGVVLWDVAEDGIDFIQSLEMPPAAQGLTPDFMDNVASKVWRDKGSSVQFRHHLSWSADGQRLLAVSANQARVFERRNESELNEKVNPWKPLATWDLKEKPWLTFALSPDGETVASGGADHLIRLWSAESGEEQARWQAHEAPISALTYGPEGKLLASGAADQTLKVWNLPLIRSRLEALGLNWSDE